MGGHLVTGATWTTLASNDRATAPGNDDGHPAAGSQADVTVLSHPLVATQIDDVDMAPTPADTPTAPGYANTAPGIPSRAKRSKLDDPEASADEQMTQGGDNGYLMAAGPASDTPAMPPPPPPPTPPSSGTLFQCFMCDHTFANDARFMLVHACRAHPDEIIPPSSRVRLAAIGRGI